MNKLAKKISVFVITIATLFIVALPVWASEIQIDFANEEIKGVTTDKEFSFNKTDWFSVYESGSVLDISSVISNTKDGVFYYRNVDGTGDLQTVEIPARPVAPSGIKFDPGVDVDDDVITTTSTQEFKVGNSLWVQSPADGVRVKTAITAGATFSVRTAATSSSFASIAAKVTVPKQDAKPSAVKYDYKKDVINVTSTMEYQVAPVRSAADIKDNVITTEKEKWISVGSSLKALDRDLIESALGDANGIAPATVYVRVKATSTKSSSQITALDVPAAVAAPSTVKLDLANEKLTSLTSKMEYRILTDKAASTATVSTPAWTSISTSSVSLTKALSPASSKTPNTLIQVRYKDVAVVGSTPAKPASFPLEFKIAKRAVTPKITAVTLNFTAGAETMSMASTIEYRLGTDTKWTDGGEAIAIASKVPGAGSKPIVVSIRAKAIEAADGDSINVPASTVLATLKIPASPAAPKAVFNTKTKRVTGVNAKMEYAIGSSTDFTPVTGTYIDLSDQAAGATITVKVRLMSTAKAPVSAVKTVSGTLTEK